MVVSKTALTRDEVIRPGKELYARDVCAKVESDQRRDLHPIAGRDAQATPIAELADAGHLRVHDLALCVERHVHQLDQASRVR